MDVVAAFTEAMAKHGLHPQHVIPDGDIHRFRTGDKRSDKLNGWYKLQLESDHAWGVFGDWSLNLKQPWVSKKAREFTDAERAIWDRRRQQMQKKAEARKRHAAGRADWIWARAEVKMMHDYIKRKRILPFKCRLYKGSVVIPVFKQGLLTSLQFIKPDGSKKFLKDGDWVGGYCPIGRPTNTIIICEGFSTGCSLHEATGIAVAVAFNSTNLLPVAEAIKLRNPSVALLICADNDRDVRYRDGAPWNPGVEAARKVAEKVGGEICWPEFPEGELLTDFNDLHVRDGLEAVRQVVLHARAQQLLTQRSAE